MNDFYREALALQPEMVARRRDLHKHPELSFQEVRTAGIVAQELHALGLEVRTGIGKTGVVGLLEGDKDGPTVLVRADMDALPIHEANATDYTSETNGVMHACGHDGHTAIGLAVAKMLSAQRGELAGRVKFVFQPAEELGAGAQAMIQDGVLEDPRPDVSLALHLWNETPAGMVAVASGPVMAGVGDWTCDIHGKGGHAAIPHTTHDPVLAAAHIITALQSLVSREVSPLDSAVVSVCQLHGGDTNNVIPDMVKLGGTTRAYLPETHTLLASRMRNLINGMATAFRCRAEFVHNVITIPVRNDQDVTRRVREITGQVVGADKLMDWTPSMVGEDMAYLMDDVPGCFILVGTMNSDLGFNAPHHSSHFDIDESALPVGAAVLAATAASYLRGG